MRSILLGAASMALIVLSSPVLADPVFRVQLSAPLLFTDGSPVADPAAFTMHPASISVSAGRSGSVLYAVENAEGAMRSIVLDSSSTDAAVPDWLTASADSISIAPPLDTPIRTHGPFQLRLQMAGQDPVLSAPFSISTTAYVRSADLHAPVSATIQNDHIATPVNGGMNHGYPVNGKATSDALYDGLDDPIITARYAGYQSFIVHHGEAVLADTCHVRIHAPGSPAGAYATVWMVRPDYSGFNFNLPLSPEIDGWREYRGDCQSGGADTWVLRSAVGIYGMNASLPYSVVEFRIGYEGAFPSVP